MKSCTLLGKIGRLFVSFAMAFALLLAPEWASLAYAEEAQDNDETAILNVPQGIDGENNVAGKKESQQPDPPSENNSASIDAGANAVEPDISSGCGEKDSIGFDNAATDSAPVVADLETAASVSQQEAVSSEDLIEKTNSSSNEPSDLYLQLSQNDQLLEVPYTVHVGTKVDIKPLVSGEGSASVAFNYGWNYQDKWVDWNSTMKVEGSKPTSATTYSFVPSKSGFYGIFVDAYLPSGEILTKQLKLNVVENWKVESISLPTKTVNVGNEVLIDVETSGVDASAARFNYGWCYGGSWANGDWGSVVLTDGSPTADLHWSFVPDRSGIYTVFVDSIRTDGSKTTKSYTVKVDEGWSFAGVRASASFIELGDSLTVEADVSGSNADVARFNYVWNYEGEWIQWSSTLLESGYYSNSSSWVFTPTRAGRYVLYVDAVRTDGSCSTKQVSINVTSTWSATGLTLTSQGEELVGNKVALGSPLEVSVRMSQGSNLTGLQYNFVWQRGSDWSEWDSLSNEGKLDSTGSHTYVFSEQGVYWIYVDVLGTDGTVRTLSSKINVVLPYAASGVVLSSGAINVGETVTISPKIAGDYAAARFNYGYAFDNQWDDWDSTVASTGKNTAEDSWTFKPQKYGVYLIFIDVVAPDGSIQTFKAQLTVNRGWNPGSFTVDKTSPQKVGTALNFSVSTTGAQSQYVQYNFVWMRDNWSDWSSTLLDNGSRTNKSTFSFTPNHSGNYMFAVDFYDTRTGQQTTKYINIRVDKTWSASTLNLSYSSPLRPWTNVTFSPVVAGDTTGLTYNYVWQRDNWAQWDSTSKSSGSFSSARTATMSIGSSGAYSFYADIKDANGEVETVQVTNVRGYSQEDIISRIQKKLDSGSVSSGAPYNNALLAAGGQLCGGKWTLWCATYIWWGFYMTGFSDLWGTSGINVDPEYLAEEFASIGRYHGGTSGIQRGDIAFMYYEPWRGGQYITHAAYVVGTTNSTITVMEGNTRGGKYATYSRWSSHFVGYGRPAY